MGAEDEEGPPSESRGSEQTFLLPELLLSEESKRGWVRS